jgi:hypothetical protein
MGGFRSWLGLFDDIRPLRKNLWIGSRCLRPRAVAAVAGAYFLGYKLLLTGWPVR